MLNQIKAVEENAGALINEINHNDSEQKFSTERGKFNANTPFKGTLQLR